MIELRWLKNAKGTMVLQYSERSTVIGMFSTPLWKTVPVVCEEEPPCPICALRRRKGHDMNTATYNAAWSGSRVTVIELVTDKFCTVWVQIDGAMRSVAKGLWALGNQHVTTEDSDNGHAVIAPYEMGEYRTLAPFSISIERIAKDEYIGIFEEAAISFSGKTEEEVIDAIKIEVIDVYELYKSEDRLGAWPKQQLDVLEKYIAEKV